MSTNGCPDLCRTKTANFRYASDKEEILPPVSKRLKTVGLFTQELPPLGSVSILAERRISVLPSSSAPPIPHLRLPETPNYSSGSNLPSPFDLNTPTSSIPSSLNLDLITPKSDTSLSPLSNAALHTNPESAPPPTEHSLHIDAPERLDSEVIIISSEIPKIDPLLDIFNSGAYLHTQSAVAQTNFFNDHQLEFADPVQPIGTGRFSRVYAMNGNPPKAYKIIRIGNPNLFELAKYNSNAGAHLSLELVDRVKNSCDNFCVKAP